MIRKLSGLLALALFCAEATAQTMRESVVSNAGQFPFEPTLLQGVGTLPLPIPKGGVRNACSVCNSARQRIANR